MFTYIFDLLMHCSKQQIGWKNHPHYGQHTPVVVLGELAFEGENCHSLKIAINKML